MAFWEPLSAEEMAQVVNFLENDDDSILGTDIPKRLSAMDFAVQKKIGERLAKLRKENAALKLKNSRYEKKEILDIEAGEFADLGFDSVDVALALGYLIRRHGCSLSKVKLISILYEAYSSWLASKRERICIEHPVVYEKGPWFWRVAHKLTDVTCAGGDLALERIRRGNAGLAAMLQNVAAKYCDYTERDLQTYLMRTAPYRNNGRERNGGKWNKEIPDAEIFFWKKEQATNGK